MFKSLIRRIAKSMFLWADRQNRYDEPVMPAGLGYNSTIKSHPGHSNGISDHNRGMNFTVFNATGGKVIQLTTYDPRTDRTNSNLYIVTDNETLGEELGLIITRESLTR